MMLFLYLWIRPTGNCSPALLDLLFCFLSVDGFFPPAIVFVFMCCFGGW